MCEDDENTENDTTHQEHEDGDQEQDDEEQHEVYEQQEHEKTRTSKERRKQYSQSRRLTKSSREDKISYASFLQSKEHIRPSHLYFEKEKKHAQDDQVRRHTCSHAMYRDKTNFDNKYGLRKYKQYSLQ